MQDYWNKHDNYMKELKQLYSKTSKQTQNNLQALLDTFSFTSENLYNIADTQTKKRINTYIEQWKEEGLLTGYFKTLCNNMYNKTRVKNSEILELLIYSAYMEEQAKLKEDELNILYNDANYYHKEGQKEVIKATKSKKEPSILEQALFLYLMQQANYSGFTFNQYIQATMQYNVQQMYKQAVILLQQGKELKINSDEFQKIINQQNNQKLCINGDKISGSIDLQMIGLNNQVKVEGIKKLSEDDSKVRFIGINDEHQTKMCNSLDGQEFYINKENEFTRYYGETQNELRLIKIKCKGLVLGVNLPPIMHHYHHCRSYIMYLPPVENEKEIWYNTADYIRKNKITDNRVLDDKIKSTIKRFPLKFQKLINNTKIKEIKSGDSCYIGKENTIYLRSDVTTYEIIHEFGHIIEEKNNIYADKNFQLVLKNDIDKIDAITDISNIEGYDNKYEFVTTGEKFVSEYQRRVYNNDMYNNPRINYKDFTFNYNVLRDYFPEGLKYYYKDRDLLRNKDIKLYEYIKEILNE